MCLNCGCGKLSDNHGDPLNLTMSRLRLMATRNHLTIKSSAENILGTILGEITASNPRGEKDTATFKLNRVKGHEQAGTPRSPDPIRRLTKRRPGKRSRLDSDEQD